MRRAASSTCAANAASACAVAKTASYICGNTEGSAETEGTLRTDFEATDVPVIFTMVSDIAGSSPTAAYERYLRLVVDGLRACPANAPLGPPLTRDEVIGLLNHCVPAVRPRSAAAQ